MGNGVSTHEHEDHELEPLENSDDYSDEIMRFVRVVNNYDGDAVLEALLDPSFNPPQDILNQALRFSSRHGKVEVLRVLLTGSRRKAEVNSRDEKGRTAAYIAARMGQIECLRILLDVGADVNLATARKVEWTVAESRYSAAYEALRFQMERDERGGMTPLHAATRINSPECVILILEKGGEVNTKDELGQQAILYAGAWMETKDKDNIKKYEEVLELLLSKGADARANYVDDTDESDDVPVSMSALLTAASLGSEYAVKKLLENGADPRWGKGCGCCRTAIHEAAKGKHLNVLQLLLEHDSKPQDRRKSDWVNLRDYAGNTALHLAAFTGSKPCISLLLESGGNLGVVNNAGMSVIEAILIHTPNAKEFICELLDSKVACSSSPEEPKDLKITLDFRILVPNGIERRAEVVNSFITARNVDSDAFSGIIDHPLVKAFINLEFSYFRYFLVFILFLYFMLVLTVSLAIYILISGDETTCKVLQGSHIFFAIMVLLHVGRRLMLNPRYYVARFEIFFNGVGALLSISGHLMHWSGFPVATDLISSACLFQWIGFMSLCGLLPCLGARVLVFGDVFKNLCWATASFIFVLIGYSLFFYLQLYSSHSQFKGFFTSFESTIIMLIQDHQHGGIYSEELPSLPSAFFRVMFVLFMFIGPMLVLNLLLSLTVSDKELTISRGKFRHIYRMVEFLDFVDNTEIISRIFCLKNEGGISSIVIKPYKLRKLRRKDKVLAFLCPYFSPFLLPKKIEVELVSLALRKHG